MRSAARSLFRLLASSTLGAGMVGGCGASQSTDSGDGAVERRDSALCGLFSRTIAQCASTSAGEFCQTQDGSTNLVPQYCTAYVTAALDSELTSATDAACPTTLAACSRNEVATLDGCAACVESLDCSSMQTFLRLRRIFPLSSIDFNEPELAPCKTACDLLAADSLSSSCLAAVRAYSIAWEAAVTTPACSAHAGGLDPTTSICRLSMSCAATCTCDDMGICGLVTTSVDTIACSEGFCFAHSSDCSDACSLVCPGSYPSIESASCTS
jgi:hypothetical protein